MYELKRLFFTSKAYYLWSHTKLAAGGNKIYSNWFLIIVRFTKFFTIYTKLLCIRKIKIFLVLDNVLAKLLHSKWKYFNCSLAAITISVFIYVVKETIFSALRVFGRTILKVTVVNLCIWKKKLGATYKEQLFNF